MLASLYQVASAGSVTFLVASSRQDAIEEAKELVEEDDPELVYLGRVANLSLGDEHETEVDLTKSIHNLGEIS